MYAKEIAELKKLADQCAEKRAACAATNGQAGAAIGAMRAAADMLRAEGEFQARQPAAKPAATKPA